MGNSGLVLLGEVVLAAQQRADMVNSNFVTPNEWLTYVTRSYKELYDLLISHFGDDYMVAAPYSFLTSSANLYPLPDGVTTTDTVTSTVAAPFYKLLGMDLQNGAAPSGFITMRRFEFTERNKYWDYAQFTNAYGILVPRYKVVGSNLWIPSPVAGQTCRMWYVPKPSNLQVTVSGTATLGSAVIAAVADTSQLAVGMSVADTIVAQGATPVIPAGTTILSIVPNVSFTMSANATANVTGKIISAWNPLSTFDGISGWEDYVIVDAARMALMKEESDPSALMAEKEALRVRIGEMAENRDASMPARVTDTTGANLGFDESGGCGWGGYP